MREIKFRGKRIDNGEWIYGMLVKSNFSSHITIMVNTMFADGVQQEEIQCLAPAVIPESVGQFTGLFDKNGKQIFDKDVIRNFSSTGHEIRHVIKWFPKEACYKLYAPQDKYFIDHDIEVDSGSLNQEWVLTCEKEVIGNAIDNPELMINFTK